jgi:biotin-dependent carboxylase-like uncharacterized protein
VSFEVVRPGPLALVEDTGRPGFAAVGVSPSGAFDRAALARGTALVGNQADHAAAVEVTLGGLVLRALDAHTVALTGAVCPASVDGHPIGWEAPFVLERGHVLVLGLPARGLRSYLSVAGGIDVPAVLGSRSTDLLSGLGPAALRPGGMLPVGPVRLVELVETAASTISTRSANSALDLRPGPRTDWLADPSALALVWTVSPDSNRVGVRLNGPPLARTPSREGDELPSEPLVRGAVQLPPSGQPVIFGPDHPTTGGYPVVAVLTEESSDRLAQCRPGLPVELRWAESWT